MTEHRETVPYTRQRAIDDTVRMLLDIGASDFEEEAVHDAERFVDQLIDVGRTIERTEVAQDTEVRGRGYQLESATRRVRWARRDRRTAIWPALGGVAGGAIPLAILWAVSPSSSLPSLLATVSVVATTVALLALFLLALYLRARAARRLTASKNDLREIFEYVGDLREKGSMIDSRRRWLAELLNEATAELGQ